MSQTIVVILVARLPTVLGAIRLTGVNDGNTVMLLNVPIQVREDKIHVREEREGR